MALSTITQLQASVQLNWLVTKTRPGLAPVTNQDTIAARLTLALGVLAGQANELISALVTIPMGTSVNVDVSGALANVVNDQNVPLARVKLFFAKLLSAADLDSNGTVIGNNCSGVTLGGDANAFLFLADKTDKAPLGNGDVLLLSRMGATGMPVTPGTGDVLLCQNNDAGVDAKLLLVLAGCDS